MSLNGVVAFITGGAGGIGLAVATALLRTGAKNVTLVDINEKTGEQGAEKLRKEFGKDRVVFLKVDVTNFSQLEDALKKTLDRFGTVDIIFNNAGILDESNWIKTIDINLKAVAAGTYLAYKYLSKQNGGKGGAVINTASIVALTIFPAIPAYQTAKFGVMGLGRAFGEPIHYERSGIRILTIYPGKTTTNIIEKHIVLDEESHKAQRANSYNSPAQSAEELAQHVVNVLKKAENGTHWMIEGNHNWRLQFPTLEEVKGSELLL